MKIKSKLLSSLVITTLFLSMAGLYTNSISHAEYKKVDFTRIYGSNRIETAIKIADRFGEAENVIIANSTTFADALVSSPLAYQMKAPILLNNKDNLDSLVKQEIIKLNAKNIYIVGGEASLSFNIEKELKDLGLNVKRISGNDRYETSSKIARELSNYVKPNRVILASGETFPDALVAGPYASEINAPILLSRHDRIDNSVDEEIKNINPNSIIAIGGLNSLNPNNVKINNRIAGSNRYQTSYILSRYMNKESVYLSNGRIFADSLVAAPLASLSNSPILLCDKYSISNDIKTIIENAKNVYVVGGPNTIEDINKISEKKAADEKKAAEEKKAADEKKAAEEKKAADEKKEKMDNDYLIKNYDKIEEKFQELINNHRKAHGSDYISINNDEKNGGQIRANELVISFSHTRPDGTSCFSAFNQYGQMAENIARIPLSYNINNIAESLFNLWKDSPGHNENMLSNSFKSHKLSMSISNGYIFFSDNFFDKPVSSRRDYYKPTEDRLSDDKEDSNLKKQVEEFNSNEGEIISSKLVNQINTYRNNNQIKALDISSKYENIINDAFNEYKKNGYKLRLKEPYIMFTYTFDAPYVDNQRIKDKIMSELINEKNFENLYLNDQANDIGLVTKAIVINNFVRIIVAGIIK